MELLLWLCDACRPALSVPPSRPLSSLLRTPLLPPSENLRPTFRRCFSRLQTGGATPLGPEKALVLICSTQGDGVAPSEARKFVDWFASGAAPKLAGTHFTVAALGDKSYTHFCRAGKVRAGKRACLCVRHFYARAGGTLNRP